MEVAAEDLVLAVQRGGAERDVGREADRTVGARLRVALLRERALVRPLGARSVEDRAAVEVPTWLGAEDLDDRRQHVYELDVREARLAPVFSRALDEERYGEDVLGMSRLVELPPALARPEAHPVIGRHDEKTAVIEADLVEMLE